MTKEELEEGTKLSLDFDKRNGLLPVIVQEKVSGQILMLGYTNEMALEKTLRSRLATFWSTSRQALWTKGETSGDYLYVHHILVDCDQDALVYQVELMGNGVCHTRHEDGTHRKSCFYRSFDLKSHKLINLSSADPGPDADIN
ncbi:MAG: phosphoribosyl-AMP cyclohydrolase [Cyclobacteriaceae bacterium]